jgi:hypothetical protein
MQGKKNSCLQETIPGKSGFISTRLMQSLAGEAYVFAFLNNLHPGSNGAIAILLKLIHLPEHKKTILTLQLTILDNRLIDVPQLNY